MNNCHCEEGQRPDEATHVFSAAGKQKHGLLQALRAFAMTAIGSWGMQ
jgi:hypothetical protein